MFLTWGNFDGVFIQMALWDTNWEVVGAKGYFSAHGSKIWVQGYVIAWV